MLCGSCGRENREGRKFCAECGSPLAAVCAACGAANQPDERFCGECGTPLAGAPPPTAVASAPAPAVERRLVSVLFADLVGFTSFSEGRDAEEVRELLSRYFEASTRVVERYGGTVEKFIGDAVMAIWGTPVAREDDAERAVRAALDVVDAVAALGLEGVAARAGVLTGEAAVNIGATGQGMVAGDLVNTASRVQAAAQPGAVLVGDATRRATDAAIAYAEAGSHELKGKTEPVQLWQALQVVGKRSGADRTSALEAPFVGRDRELRLVKELFHASADERRAQLVTIIGIAGIGKSRLAWEFEKYVDGIVGAIRWHRGRCVAYGDGVTYWALAEMVRMRCGIAENEEQVAAREKLRTALREYVADEDERAWIETRLAHLLALEERQAEQADLFAGWRLFFERMAERGPIVLVFEDMQWADGALVEFLEHLLEWSRSHPILVLALARPELAERHPDWGKAMKNASTLALEPLPRAAVEELLDGLVPGLEGDLRDRIVERAEGIPLYAVETVRMLLDKTLLERAGDAYRPTGPIEALDVPETLHALGAARLDALAGEERALVQTAAVLGKFFTRDAVAKTAGLADELADRLLAALVRKEILSLQADPRSPERGQYGFLQDLLRQVAYETLPRGERKARHLAAAAQLEQSWHGEQEIVEILASHYVAALELEPDADDAAEIRDRAKAALVHAGERAASLGASDEAQRYFEQALKLAGIPREEAELAERAGRMARLGAHWPEARAHLERARDAFESLGLTHPAARVAAVLAEVVRFEGDVSRAIDGLEQALSVLGEEEPDADVAIAAAQLGRFLYFAGRHDEAMARIEVALELAESLDVPEVLSQALNTKNLLLAARGRTREAEVLVRHALEVALANDLHAAALRAYNNLLFILYETDRLDEDVIRAALELAQRVGDRAAVWSARLGLAGMLVRRGEWDQALAIEAEDAAEWPREARVLAEGAHIYALRGDLAEARRRIEGARPLVDSADVQDSTEFASREAWVLLAEGRHAEAQSAAESALAGLEALSIRHGDIRLAIIAALESAFAGGNRQRADELLALIERTPPGHLPPFLAAVSAWFAARRAALDGDRQTPDAGYAGAVATLRRIGEIAWTGWVLLEHAEWLVAQGRADEAEPLLDEAEEILTRCGAKPFLERIQQAREATALQTTT